MKLIELRFILLQIKTNIFKTIYSHTKESSIFNLQQQKFNIL